ncbi:MAG: DUF2723 domain-containing protein [Candidatus Eisenbacteria bacterium]|nr:DUF2723 domain-containing protein [Candidatus Eisenbacteria bacterium]
MNHRLLNRLMTALSVALPFIVYMRTMPRTVPFWDAGEFISVSKILGIPHPPGTPLFVLTGHVFGLLPFWNYATRINFVSVVTGMLTIAFTYLLVQKAVMHLPLFAGATGRGAASGEAETAEPTGEASADLAERHWLSYIAGLVAAWSTAFSHSFWNTSTEIAHVHVGASAIMFFSLWVSVNWWERLGEKGNERRLLVIWYLLCAGIGWHLGGFLVLPAVVMFTLVVDWRRSWWIGIGAVIFVLWMNGTGMLMRRADELQHDVRTALLSGLILLALALAAHVLLRRNLRPFLWVSVGALVAGLSVHGYLVVRAKQNPIINEAAPSTWNALWKQFTREQYAPPSPLERSGNWTYQFEHMFLRYFRDEFTLGPPMQSKPGVRPWTGLLAFLAMGIPLVLGEFGRLYHLLKGRGKPDAWWIAHLVTWVLIVALFRLGGRVGGEFMGQPFDGAALAIALFFLMCVADVALAVAWQRPLYVLVSTAFLMGSLWLVIYLNFKDPQVRERDYFFLWGYEAFTVWMGVGAAGVIHEVIRLLKLQALRRVLVPVLGLLALCMPVATCAHYYFEQDRTGNFVARDYAYNMLAPLAQGAIIFTNGDNDTFPLWYLQEVEGIRSDVRVVNLSLLNTTWYIKQMRDLEPRVPIQFTDSEVDALEPYRAPDGSIVLVKDILVHHIVRENAYRKPIYLAVTVPEQMGLERQLMLEGLAFRILPDSAHEPVNVEATRKAVYETFLYRGLLDAQGNLTPVPYKDDNAVRLAGNYASAHMRLAFYYRDRNELAKAVAELDRAEKISPDFSGIPVTRGMFYQERGDSASALRSFQDGLKRFPDNAELNYRMGIMVALKGDYQGGYEHLERAWRAEPDNATVALSLFTLMVQMGKIDAAESMIRSYMDAHPDDQRARAVYQDVMRRIGRTPAGAALPPPATLPGGGIEGP